MNLMKRRANRALIEDYYYRIKASGVEADKTVLMNRLEKLEENEIANTMNTILGGNEEEIVRTLQGIGVNAVSSKMNLEEEVTKKLNLESITEFDNNGKSYFKFKDKEGNIRITRNMGDDSKALFMDILNNYDIASNKDEKKNADEIFKFLSDYKFIEIGMESSKKVNDDNIPKVNKAIIEEMKKKFPNKEIIYSVEEDIYVIKGENNEKDQILNIKSLDGKISINQVEQKGYENSESKKENENGEYSEEVNSLENDEDLSKMIIDSEKDGISEDITIGNIIKHLKEKYPQYGETGNILQTATDVSKKVREKNKESIENINVGMHSGGK